MLKRMVPLSGEENVLHAFINQLFSFLPFNKVEEVQHIIVIPSDSHSGILVVKSEESLLKSWQQK